MTSFASQGSWGKRLEKESKKLLIYFDGKSYYCPELIDTIHNNQQMPDSSSCSFNQFYYHYKSSIQDFDLLYFPQRSFKKSIEEIEETLKNNYQEVYIVAFSHGTISAMKSMMALFEKGFIFNGLITFDSVSKNISGLMNNLLADGNDDVVWFDRASVNNWINIYQKDDRKTFVTGISGNSYPEADYNIQFKSYNKGHQSIVADSFYNFKIKDIIKNIFL